jgi:molybdopterin converting factor small subunit
MGTGQAARVNGGSAPADAHGPTVSIRYLSAVRELAGRRRDEVPMPAGSTLAAAADWIRATRGLEVPGPGLMSTLNGHGWTQLPEGMATLLREGDEIALFPLISGG